MFARLGDWGVLGQVDLTLEAVVYGLVFGLRLLVVALACLLVVCAADPDELLLALRRVSPHSALTAALATRMVGVLGQDARRLAEAQRCRADGGAGGTRARVAVLRATVQGALDRALDVAAVLEMRGYGAGRRARRRGASTRARATTSRSPRRGRPAGDRRRRPRERRGPVHRLPACLDGSGPATIARGAGAARRRARAVRRPAGHRAVSALALRARRLHLRRCRGGRAARRQPDDRARRVLRAGRAVGVGQVDAAEGRRRPRAAFPRRLVLGPRRRRRPRHARGDARGDRRPRRDAPAGPRDTGRDEHGPRGARPRRREHRARSRRRRPRGGGGRARARDRRAAGPPHGRALRRRAAARRPRGRARRAPAARAARRADLAARPGRRRRADLAAAAAQPGVRHRRAADRASPRALPRRGRPCRRDGRRRAIAFDGDPRGFLEWAATRGALAADARGAPDRGRRARAAARRRQAGARDAAPSRPAAGAAGTRGGAGHRRPGARTPGAPALAPRRARAAARARAARRLARAARRARGAARRRPRAGGGRRRSS